MHPDDSYGAMLHRERTVSFCGVEIRTAMGNGFFLPEASGSQTHNHPHFELHVLETGAYRIGVPDGRSIRLTPGTACLIPPACYHETDPLSGDCRIYALRFFVHCTQTEPAAEWGSVFFALQEPVFLPDSMPLCTLFRQVAAELPGNAFASDAYVGALLSQVYILLGRMVLQRSELAPSAPPSLDRFDSDAARCCKIESYLEHHIGSPASEQALADALGLSRRQLNRFFQRVYGKGFREKRTETRLYRARDLLIASGQPLEAIAPAVGFASVSAFSASFRRQFGISPGQFRKHAATGRCHAENVADAP